MFFNYLNKSVRENLQFAVQRAKDFDNLVEASKAQTCSTADVIQDFRDAYNTCSPSHLDAVYSSAAATNYHVGDASTIYSATMHICKVSHLYECDGSRCRHGDIVFETSSRKMYTWTNSGFIELGAYADTTPVTKQNPHHPTNCKNCAAVLHSNVCEYCGTVYT